MQERSRARDYKNSTLKRLFQLSGNECAAPNCNSRLTARDGVTNIGKISHIEAASENGPRFNPDMSDDERRHFENLILLCDECHTIIDNKDNEEEYPVDLLHSWKKDHESTKTYTIFSTDPSLLSKVIEAISKLDFEIHEDEKNNHKHAFSIDEKIKYNDIKRNKPLLEEYKVFYTKVNTLYHTLEEEGSFVKENLLRNIRRLYLKVLGHYTCESDNKIDVIRSNADNIFEDVLGMLIEGAEKTVRNSSEDISFGVTVVMVDAFMRCKILERPRLI